MRRGLLLIIFITISVACLAEPKKDRATLEKEFTTLARESHVETVKNFCVNSWIEPNKRDILSKFASVAEMCECILAEMKFIVSDDLAVRLFNMQIGQQAGTPDKYASEEENSRTTKEWFVRYSAADGSCKERFIRRRSQR